MSQLFICVYDSQVAQCVFNKLGDFAVPTQSSDWLRLEIELWLLFGRYHLTQWIWRVPSCKKSDYFED